MTTQIALTPTPASAGTALLNLLRRVRPARPIPVIADPVDAARATLPQFLAAFATDAADWAEVAVQVTLPLAPHRAVWLDALTFAAEGGLSGSLRHAHAGLPEGTRVTVTDAQVCDWTFQQDGVVYGRFGQRAAMIDVRSPRDAQYDRATRLRLSPEPLPTGWRAA